MASKQRTVLITGCSDGGLGAALAIALHKKGLKVYATARDPNKMRGLADLGIERLILDILSDDSIANCAGKLPSLDILVNNAGSQYMMPTAEIDIVKAKKLFDLNVWSQMAVTQAFLPLLLKSPDAMVVNQTSVCAVVPLPFQGVYNASKAAFSMLSETLRLELQPLGVKVVELRAGSVSTNLLQNTQATNDARLPRASIYEPARDIVEKTLRQEVWEPGTPTDQWADGVVCDLLKKNPPSIIWKGQSSLWAWISTMLPAGTLDSMLKKSTGLDKVEEILGKRK